MSGILGFGGPLATMAWLVAMVATAWWTIRQLLRWQLVTVTSVTVLLGFFVPVIIQYPFTFSPINGLTIGLQNYTAYVPYVDGAFLLTMLGVAMFAAGYQLAGGRPQRFLPLAFVLAGVRAWRQGAFLYLSSLFIIVLFGLLFAVGLVGAEGARNLAQLNPALRPLYNIAHVLLPLTIGLTLLVANQRRDRLVFLLAMLNIALGVLTGARAVIFGGILLFALTTLTYPSLQRRLRIGRALRIVPLALLLLLLVVYAGDVRAGQYNIFLSAATFGAKLFYGNTFSDLRDFAWVRSAWHGGYFWGRTELAGLLAFVPSALSSFRSEWNWGVVTTSLTGLDPKVTPGLRVGPFGEVFFNFGLPGVILAGLAYGVFIRRLHNAMLDAVHHRSEFEAKTVILAGFVTASFAGTLLNTAGFYGLYLTLLVLGGLQLFDFMLRAMRPPAVLPPDAGHPVPGA